MEKPGWKDAEGRTLEQLQDWSKDDSYPPAKGLGGDVQKKVQKATEPQGSGKQTEIGEKNQN